MSCQGTRDLYPNLRHPGTWSRDPRLSSSSKAWIPAPSAGMTEFSTFGVLALLALRECPRLVHLHHQVGDAAFDLGEGAEGVELLGDPIADVEREQVELARIRLGRRRIGVEARGRPADT